MLLVYFLLYNSYFHSNKLQQRKKYNKKLFTHTSECFGIRATPIKVCADLVLLTVRSYTNKCIYKYIQTFIHTYIHICIWVEWKPNQKQKKKLICWLNERSTKWAFCRWTAIYVNMFVRMRARSVYLASTPPDIAYS